MPKEITITFASVKVMRSYDYCHFEINLSADMSPNIINDDNSDQLKEVDELRKAAARLADKAVEQYKVAKENTSRAEYDVRGIANMMRDHEDALAKPDSERTPEEKATVKAIGDAAFKRRRYDYEDLWEEDVEWQRPSIPGDPIF